MDVNSRTLVGSCEHAVKGVLVFPGLTSNRHWHALSPTMHTPIPILKTHNTSCVVVIMFISYRASQSFTAYRYVMDKLWTPEVSWFWSNEPVLHCPSVSSFNSRPLRSCSCCSVFTVKVQCGCSAAAPL